MVSRQLRPVCGGLLLTIALFGVGRSVDWRTVDWRTVDWRTVDWQSSQSRAIAQPSQPSQPSPSPSVRPSPAPPALQPPVPLTSVPPDDQLWSQTHDRPRLIQAIDHSLAYLKQPKSLDTYKKYLARYPKSPFTHDRVRRTLVRFRQLLLSTRSEAEFQRAIAKDFQFARSVGRSEQGQVGFTGYYEAVYPGSPVRTNEYKYPLFRLPPNFAKWPKTHPTREALEGRDGVTIAPVLKGLELVWMRDRLEAFLVQVQGSARLQLTNGKVLTVGYAAATNYPYVGIGRELVKDGKFTLEELTLKRLKQYFRDHPEEMDVYLPRNQRFVFFKNTLGAPALGSLNVPVTAERSIATDKSLFPPGALTLISATLPVRVAPGQFEQRPISRYMLDQDTGGAIKGPARVDIFMGTGPEASDRAGLVNADGELYYLLLK